MSESHPMMAACVRTLTTARSAAGVRGSGQPGECGAKERFALATLRSPLLLRLCLPEGKPMLVRHLKTLPSSHVRAVRLVSECPRSLASTCWPSCRVPGYGGQDHTAATAVLLPLEVGVNWG